MSHEEARRRMVEEQLAARGIADARVLAAMGRVPRHRFVAERLKDEAYEDPPSRHGAVRSGPGYARPLVRVEDFHRLVEESSYGDDRVRPCS